MIIADIDGGTSCGWAVGSNTSEAIAAGRWNLAVRPGDSPGVAYLLLRKHLEDIRQAYPTLKMIVYEHPHHRGRAATKKGYGWTTTIETWCAERKIEHAGIHSGTLKKHATGHGNASKAELIAVGRKRWDLDETVTDDEVDARFLLDLALKDYAS